MVYANLESASSSVADAFRSRDITTLATTGGIASLGFMIAVSVGSGLSNIVGLDTNSRVGMAAVAVGAALAAMGQLKFLGPSIGGAMSIGALVAVGTGVILTLVGPRSPRDGYFRGVVDSADMAGDIPVPKSVTGALPATGCSSCGGSHTQPQPQFQPKLEAQTTTSSPHGSYR